MIKVYDYYQEENKALEERFTLASERIYEIQNEAELCAPYASYVTMVASFHGHMELCCHRQHISYAIRTITAVKPLFIC